LIVDFRLFTFCVCLRVSAANCNKGKYRPKMWCRNRQGIWQDLSEERRRPTGRLSQLISYLWKLSNDTIRKDSNRRKDNVWTKSVDTVLISNFSCWIMSH